MTEHRAEPAELRARMVARLAAVNDVARWEEPLAPWWPALATVPRHEFIPDTVWIKNPGRGPTLLPVHRHDDPDRWLELTYGDDAVITQIDDGHPRGPGLAGAMQTSSASAPDIVAVMLAALDAHLGHRVLEIGTGTGYNAALLAHRLGAERITSIEVDSDIAAQARTALSETGYSDIRAITGDGALGYSPCAPYDRIIATADPHSVAGDQGARFTIGQRVQHCQWRYWPFDEQTGTGVLWLLDFVSRSWAKLTHRTPYASDDEFPVHQHGPWRFTVTPEGQRIELD